MCHVQTQCLQGLHSGFKKVKVTSFYYQKCDTRFVQLFYVLVLHHPLSALISCSYQWPCQSNQQDVTPGTGNPFPRIFSLKKPAVWVKVQVYKPFKHFSCLAGFPSKETWRMEG